ncbi:ATP-dependent helicase, partial [Helicobacter pylori]|nr:ATP-dependent helicase [Helicobacter pylori]
AITRAKEGLQLSYVKERSYFGRKISCSPSVFLEEAKLLKQDNPPKQDHKKDAPIKVGDLIKHKIFGTG